MKPERKLVLRKYNYLQREKLCAFLGKMAEKGWLLCGATLFFWKFRKIEPQKLRFSIVYVPSASDYMVSLTDELLEFQDFCKHSGWFPILMAGYHQIYCTSEENATPIETDSDMELKGIREGARRIILWNVAAALGCGMIWGVELFLVFGKRFPDAISSNWFLLFTLAVFGILFFAVAGLISYVSWWKKAKRLQERTGEIPGNGPSSVPMRFSMALSYLVLVFIGLYETERIGLFRQHVCAIRWGSLAIYCLILLVICLIRDVLSFRLLKKGTPKKNKWIVNVTALLLGFVLGSSAWLVPAAVKTQPRLNQIKYECQDREFIAYADPLFLQIENFDAADAEEYSYELKRKGKSVLVEYEKGSQTGRWTNLANPSLKYTYICDRTGCLHGMLLSYLKRHLDDGRGYNEDGTTGCTVESVEAPAWGAKAVYRLFDCGEPTRRYLVDFGDRFLEIEYDEELTGEQIAIIRDIVMHS